MGWHQRLPLGSLNVVSGTYLIGTGILLSRDDAMVQRALGRGQGLPWERRNEADSAFQARLAQGIENLGALVGDCEHDDESCCQQ
jgi:hypothetical protein